MSNLFWLTGAQMARPQPFFPKSLGKPRVDDRRVLNGIIFINRNGLRWYAAPREDGPAKTLYNRWAQARSAITPEQRPYRAVRQRRSCCWPNGAMTPTGSEMR